MYSLALDIQTPLLTTRSLKVLFVAAEAAPYAKVGGLADVAGALPKALARLGHDVRLILPRYASIDEARFRLGIRKDGAAVSYRGQRVPVTLREASAPASVPAYFIESPIHFDRPTIYGEPDDLDRFAFFCLAALEAPALLGWQPDVLHAHDWHAALAIARARSLRRGATPATVFSIHNAQYQGHFSPEWPGQALPEADSLRIDSILTLGAPPSMSALGIVHADAINTVSETYAREVLTPEFGYGLEKALQSRRNRLFGIINGIDYQEYDPATDPHIPTHYSADDPGPRRRNKAALQRRVRLPVKASAALLGMVTRLVDQKGLDILAQALPGVLEGLDVQFVLLGTGQPQYHRLLREVAERYPSKVAFVEAFDPALGQLIYAGCDIFLMPSRFEPCGLGQLIALRYGAIPLVRRTGGLADTVQDCGDTLDRGNGFVFERYDAEALAACVQRAAQAYARRQAWRRLMARGMRLDFSWEASARRYADLYEKALVWAAQDRKGSAAS